MSSGKTTITGVPNMFSSICFLSETSPNTYSVCKLKQNVQSLPEASFSPILTLGAFILFHHNQVQPPRFQCHQKTNGKVDKKYPSEQLTVNNLHQPWNDYLQNLVVEGKVYQVADQIYFVDFVDTTYLESFINSDIFEIKHIQQENFRTFLQANDFPSIIQEIYGLQKKKIKKSKKFAAICFAAKAPIHDRYLPKVHVSALFFGLFYRQTDVWKVYRPVQGHLPTQEQLQQFDGVVLSGSAHSVYEDVPQINEFMSILVKAYRKNENLKILGFCFGHQSIAYAFGGKVQKMPGQIVKLENIKFDHNKIKELQMEWFDKKSSFLDGTQEYLISEFHGDEVVQIPPGFTVIGSSKSCGVEAMISNNGRIMSFQFHMEYTPEFAGAYELRLRSYDLKIRYGTIYHGSSKLKGCQRNRRSIFELRQISRNFIHSDFAKNE